jgi:hypothetical protein
MSGHCQTVVVVDDQASSGAGLAEANVAHDFHDQPPKFLVMFGMAKKWA